MKEENIEDERRLKWEKKREQGWEKENYDDKQGVHKKEVYE